MSTESLHSDVLNELGDDRLQELATEMGTDTDGAKQVVQSTVSELPPEVTEPPQPSGGGGGLGGLTGKLGGLTGGLGGAAGGAMGAGMAGKVAGPVADAVSKRTGLPREAVLKGVEMVLPVVMKVIAKRKAG